MATPGYDVVVLGAGGVGSAAMWRLARRGARVLGIDRFHPPHDQGSSHGQTRIIRQAYFEHPDYVPLVRVTYDLWRELEELSRQRLFERAGLIQAGPADGVVVPGVLRAAEEHRLAVEKLTADQASKRWPQLRFGDDQDVLFEPTAGFLWVERCVQACLDAAIEAGAETRFGSVVHGWRGEGAGLVVETDDGDIACDRLVVAAGPWAGGLLQQFGLRLELRRQALFWFGGPEDHIPGRLPPFLFEDSEGCFYAIPAGPPAEVKIGDHGLGQRLDSPDDIDRSMVLGEQQRAVDFLSRRAPGVDARIAKHATCFYTMSPDEHFIVDHAPGDKRVALAAGLSGHGFKFTPVLGEALADLVLDGATGLPIEFLSLSRFAV